MVAILAGSRRLGRDYLRLAGGGMSEIVLRRWQAEALPLMIEAVRDRVAAVLAAFMGAGKAWFAAELVRRSKERPGYVVIVCAPGLKLVRQLAETFGKALGSENVGEWHGKSKVKNRRVIVSTYRSLPKLAAALKEAGLKPALLICDEAHRTETEEILAAIEDLAKLTTGGHMARIALTATAFRSDKKQALSVWDKVIYRYSYQDGLRDGVIVPYRVIGWDGVGKPEDVDAVTVDMLRKYAVFPALTDASNIKDAEAFAERLTTEGMPAAAIHSDMTEEDAQKRIAALRGGELKVLVHVSMLAEGSDFPWLRTLALRRNIGARVRFVQQCGRVLRVDPSNPEKREGIILDPLDLMGLHGLSHPEALGKALDEGEDGEEGEEGTEKPAKKTAAERRAELEALEGMPLRAWLIEVLTWVCAVPTDGERGVLRSVGLTGAVTDRQIEVIEQAMKFLKWWPHKPTKDRIRAWVKDGRIRTLTRGEASGLISLLFWLRDASAEARQAQGRGEYHLAAGLFDWPKGVACPDEVPRLDGERGVG